MVLWQHLTQQQMSDATARIVLADTLSADNRAGARHRSHLTEEVTGSEYLDHGCMHEADFRRDPQLAVTLHGSHACCHRRGSTACSLMTTRTP